VGALLTINDRYGAAIHTAPSSDAQAIAILPCGQSLTVIGSTDGWDDVSAGNVSGWVGGARVTPAKTTIDCRGAVTFPLDSLATTHVDSGCLSLRDSPAKDAPFKQCVANGTQYRVTGGPMLADGEDWIPVSSPSLGSGWVQAQFLVPSGR